MDIGEMIMQRRLELGLTLDDVGRAVGVSKSTVQKWESGMIKDMRRDKIAALAKVLNMSPVAFIDEEIPNAIPVTGQVPILGTIPAGYPAYEESDIIGYQVAPVNNTKDYFYLRVKGDSMINKGIADGCLVLIHKQSCAENGQVVACRVNGDEATLKIFQQEKNTVILMPANPAYSPVIVSTSQFKTGEAAIYGVVKFVLTEM